MYAVLILNKTAKIKVNNCYPPLEDDINLCFADGMIGALPVFESYESAKEYAPDGQILEIETIGE